MRSTDTGRRSSDERARRLPAGRVLHGARWLVALALAGCTSPAQRPADDGIVTIPARPNAPTVPELVALSPQVRRDAALPAPRAVRNWNEVREQAAQRLMAANPDRTYTGKPPDPLLAIPVLEIELNGDGSIRRIEVLRHPRQAKDTTQLAADALRRAAPFGDVSRLPRPWKFVETFLFDDDRRFKPRTLDR